MEKRVRWTLGPEIQVETFKFQDDCWVVSASGAGTPVCPACGNTSSSRHSWHNRQLQDLPAQGAPVVLKLRLGRWRCHNDQCIRKTFVERLPSIVAPFARRTSRVAELVRLFGHAAGGRVSERLLARLAMWVSDNTILRQLKNYARNVGDAQPIRIVGIDDWCWRRGDSYGTIIVDLERRKVVDVLPKRSVEETATWLKRHPEIEIVSRDRCGLYAQGARDGAPQAKQVADRFHLLQNLREAIEQQMTNLGHFAGRSLLPAEAGDLNPAPRQARRET